MSGYQLQWLFAKVFRASESSSGADTNNASDPTQTPGAGQQKSEGFLKSVWHKLTDNPSHDANDTAGTTSNPAHDTDKRKKAEA